MKIYKDARLHTNPPVALLGADKVARAPVRACSVLNVVSWCARPSTVQSVRERHTSRTYLLP